MDADKQMLEETYRLAKDNNHMLHSMRRNAFLGGIVKFILYALIFVVAPLWIYTNYVSPLMQEAVKTINQVQGTGNNAQSQLNGLVESLKQLESKIPGLPKTN